MNTFQMGNAKLDEAQLAKLRALEADLGKWAVALESRARLAELSESQLKRLQAVENDLRVVLIAYGPT